VAKAHEGVHRVALQPEAEGEAARLERQEAGERVDPLPKDLLRRLPRGLLDVHAALERGHHGQPPGLAVERHAQVQLPGDAAALLDVDLPDLLPVRTGLRRLQHHAQHGLGVLPGLVRGAGQPDASTLPPASGVDLRLHRADAAAELAGGALGLERRDGEVAAGHGHAELPQDLLRLVLVIFTSLLLPGCLSPRPAPYIAWIRVRRNLDVKGPAPRSERRPRPTESL